MRQVVCLLILLQGALACFPTYQRPAQYGAQTQQFSGCTSQCGCGCSAAPAPCPCSQAPQPAAVGGARAAAAGRTPTEAINVRGIEALLGEKISLTEFTADGYNAEGGGPVQSGNALTCNFDGTPCCWANVPPPDDQLDWQIATGTPAHLQNKGIPIPTGTYLVAYAKAAAPSDEAQFASCSIGCSSSDIIVRAKHWQSENVLLQVCLRESFPNNAERNPLLNCQEFPYVSGLTTTEVVLPKTSLVDIVFVASNFVGDSGDVAILDDIEVSYDRNGEECQNQFEEQLEKEQSEEEAEEEEQTGISPGGLKIHKTGETTFTTGDRAAFGSEFGSVSGSTSGSASASGSVRTNSGTSKSFASGREAPDAAKRRELLEKLGTEGHLVKGSERFGKGGFRGGESAFGSTFGNGESGSRGAAGASGAAGSTGTAGTTSGDEFGPFDGDFEESEENAAVGTEHTEETVFASVKTAKLPSKHAIAKGAKTAAFSESICNTTKCDFEDGDTCNYLDAHQTQSIRGLTTKFRVVSGQFMNRVTGVKESIEGDYYAAAFLFPREMAGLEAITSPFTEESRLKFQYYEGTHGVQLKGCCSNIDNCPFSSDKFVTVSDRVWKTASFKCPVGTDKVIFLCENTRTNQGACAVDDLGLVETAGALKTAKPMC